MGEIISDVRIGIDTDKDSRIRKVGRNIRRRVKQILTTSNMYLSDEERELVEDVGDGRTRVLPVSEAQVPSPYFVPQEIPPQPTEVALWIIIPTYNRPEEFKKCVGSVARQLGPRDHIIAVASGFKMFEHVREMSFNPKVTGLLLGDVIVNVARKTALGLVPDDAVVVEIGDNDYVRMHSLSRIRAAFEDTEVGVVYGDFIFMDKDGNTRGEPMKKPAWEPGVMHKRCEIRGMHAYRKTVYLQYGGWYENEHPAGDHANAMRWEDAGVKFVSLRGNLLVNCTYDRDGMSVARRSEQHKNSQAFSRGEYRRKYSIGMVCWSVAGRRTKMLALLDKICDPEKIKIYASSKGRYGTACDTDDHIRKRIVWWGSSKSLDAWLPNHEVAHLFVDRMNFASRIAAGDRRVVVDVCDLRTQRTGDHKHEDEKLLCTSPNVWLMFVSEGHRDYICEKYGLPVERTHIVQNLPMKAWRPEDPLKEEDRVPNSIVYYGGITAKKNHIAAYRYYYDIFKAFKDAEIDVHIYPSGSRGDEVKEGYKEFNVHDRFHHRDIYSVLRKYSAGLAGYEDRAGCPEVSHNYAMRCYPNKATDYMMAGIPTVSYALGLAEKDVKNWGVCVQKGDAHKLVDAYFEALKKDIQYDIWQNQFCMESQAPKIIEAYDWVAGR